ncbi:MAG: hypothetical protein JNM25_17940 [Planctomycetes bacterium]|nr:hypothetical protein [Planctomycetota bacterium]
MSTARRRGVMGCMVACAGADANRGALLADPRESGTLPAINSRCDGGLTERGDLPTIRGYSGAAKKVESRVCPDRTLGVRGRRRREKSKAARVQDAVRNVLSGLRSQVSGLRSTRRLVAPAALIVALGAPATAQFIPESTHDWTSTAGAPADLSEAWADTKTPGKGLTYSVGTIEVEQTGVNPTFSNAGVDNPPGGAVPFDVVRRQVVIVQCVDAAGTIQWQRYFFGTTNVPGARRATNARAISVWEAETAADARIAICGETYDDTLPLSQAPAGFVQNPLLQPDPTGFVAVYNGEGLLLWTHHFFGVPLAFPELLQNQPDCAITDLSIRVEGEGENRRDVVTYCGISSWGNPATGNDWLDPILPFAGGTGTSAGNTDFGPYQWDGIVGRLSRDHQGPFGGLQREFQSTVGGPDQDGVFGLAEVEGNRFVVAGSARELGGSAPPIGFPFTSFSTTVGFPFQVGTLLAFDAAPTRLGVPAALELENGLALGSFDGSATHACDVIVQARWNVPFGLNTVFVVGATNDPDFLVSVGSFTTAGSDTLQGASDGFLLSALDSPVTNQLVLGGLGGVFVGGNDEDGLTGVSSWNEHTDHTQVCGWSVVDGSPQIQVASFFLDAWIHPVRREVFGGAGQDLPAVMGAVHAGNGGSGVAYATGLLFQQPAGGGIGADERARITVVGASTAGAGFPVVGGRGPLGGQDAVRTELDMLPLGVGRTDGTGTLASGAAAPPPPAGYSGGTTPVCMLTPSPFGLRIGRPLPYLQRMLIEFEGANGAGGTPAIWVTRPPDYGEYIVGAVQVGLPATTPVLLDQAEIWTLNSPAFLAEVWAGNNPSRMWQVPFSYTLPTGPLQISVQVACLMLTPVMFAPCGTSQLTTFASPALFYEY